MILVLGGTSESRDMANYLCENKVNVIYTSTTEHLRGVSSKALRFIGKLDEERIEKLMEKEFVRVIVDATHPYAKNITAIAIKAAEKHCVPYIRFERYDSKIKTNDNTIFVENIEKATEIIKNIPGIILSTIGTRMLAPLCSSLKERKKDLIVRILPMIDSIEECLKNEINISQIIAAQGPFSTLFNYALCKEYDIKAVLTKDSGKRGGVDAKIAVANKLNIPVIIISRPRVEYPALCRDFEECLRLIKKIEKGIF